MAGIRRSRPRSGALLPVARVPAVLLPGLLAALLVLVWAATAGPVPLFGTPSGRSSTPAPALPVPTPSPSSSPDPRSAPELLKDVRPVWDGSWIGQLLGYAALIALSLAVFAGLRLLWRHRWHPPERPAVVAFDVLPDDALAEALHRDADAQLAAVEQGRVRDGIVACWLRLEELAGASGVPRRPAETSAEFVTRLLHRLDVDPRAVGTLAGLYREARFSEHRMGEDSRTAARTALHALHDELSAEPRAGRGAR